MRYLPSLTPLRGLAALLVVMYHLTRAGADPTVPGFFLRGYLRVDLFFILSGFLLTPTLTYRAIEVPCRALLRHAPDQLRRLAART